MKTAALICGIFIVSIAIEHIVKDIRKNKTIDGMDLFTIVIAIIGVVSIFNLEG